MITKRSAAGIQYVGVAGVSAECRSAILRLLQFGDDVVRARLLTCGTQHSFLLDVNAADLVAVKNGFASGYGGEAPRALSFVLQALHSFNIDIEEFDVSAAVLRRIDNSALRIVDIQVLDATPAIRPTRWLDYVFEKHFVEAEQGMLWTRERPLIPYALVDPRIFDLAIRFEAGPDDCLMTGYRRLEDIVRERTGLTKHGAKLFAEAFVTDFSRLAWPSLTAAESKSRGALFVATYTAFRNPRAHRELGESLASLSREFLSLNHLFNLEREAVAPEQ